MLSKDNINSATFDILELLESVISYRLIYLFVNRFRKEEVK